MIIIMQTDMFVEQSKKVVPDDITVLWSDADIVILVQEYWKDEKGIGWRKELYTIHYYETTEVSRQKIYNNPRAYQ